MTTSNGTLRSRIESCSGPDLANKLCEAIKEVSETSIDLGTRISDLVGQLLKSVGSSKQPAGADNVTTAKAEPVTLDEANTLTVVPGISCANPKAKFDLVFTKTAFTLRNAKHILQIPYDSIRTVFILDSMPGDRAGKVYLLLEFKEGCTVVYGKRELKNFTIEVKDKSEVSVPSPQAKLTGKDVPNIKGAAAIVLCNCLGQMRVTSFLAPEGKVFSGRGGAKFIQAMHKFNPGFLFPLEKSLVYIGSPHCFALPTKAILGVDMPGAGSERRTFDLVLHGHSGEVLHELTQIDARDLAAWGDYMKQTGMALVATGAAADGSDKHADTHVSDGAQPHSRDDTAADGDDDDDDEDDDEDFDADKEDEESGGEGADSDDGGAGEPPEEYEGGFFTMSPSGKGTKRDASGDAGASTSKGVVGGSGGIGGAAGASAPRAKRLRSSRVAGDEGLMELPDELVEAELGALEEEEALMGGDESDMDDDDDE